MSDLFGNHIVGFPTRWLICIYIVNTVIIVVGAFLLSKCFMNVHFLNNHYVLQTFYRYTVFYESAACELMLLCPFCLQKMLLKSCHYTIMLYFSHILQLTFLF